MKLRPPALACDCHMHVFEDGYALAPTATFKPPHAPASAYQAVQKQLGLERVVVVQASGYGFDNSCMLAAMREFGAGARGVAVVAPDTSVAELERLTRLGVRGVRYFMLPGGVLGWDTLEAVAARVRPFGWHVQLQLDGRELPKYRQRLRQLPVDLVIDHNGKFLDPVATDHPAFKALLEMLDSGRVWVKLAAPYETSKVGPPGYEDVSALARALVKRNPERALWASNWPHPNRNPAPSNVALLDLLLDWAGNEATARKILADNPAQLYFKARSP